MPQGKRTWTRKVRPIRIEGDVAYIALADGGEALIDASDIPVADGWNWGLRPSLCGLKYVARGVSIGGGRTKALLLHHAILGRAGGRLVDHRDGNPLNCRRYNLRGASSAQNCWNRRISSANTSGYKGVTYRSDRGTWLACITHLGRVQKLGTYRTPEQAALAYDFAAKQMFGDYAWLNFPADGAAA